MLKINKENKEFIKKSTINDLNDENISLEETKSLTIKYPNYKIQDNKICGTGKIEKINYNQLFQKNNKFELMVDIIKLAKKIDEDKNVKKIFKYIYEYNGKIYNKTHIEVDTKNLPYNIKNKIERFFKKYGYVASKDTLSKNYTEYDLNIFIRRILDFYYNVVIWEMLIDGNLDNKIIEKYGIILADKYRKNDKDALFEGIIQNIQEKGLIEEEKNRFYVFERLYYDRLIKEPKIDICTNDYVTLAYYQLAHLIVDKHKGTPFKTCKYCGNFLEYERSSKTCCDNLECQRKMKRDNTRRCRAKKKEKEKKMGEKK